MEEVIEIASQIKDQLVSLCDLYCELPSVIEAEHDAIRNSDFDEVRKLTLVKNKIGEDVDTQFSLMCLLTEKLSLRHAAITNTLLQKSKASGMHAVVARLEDILECGDSTAMAAQVLGHVIKSLRDQIDVFDAKMLEIQPLVEMNKKVVGTMLESYRDSYRFWQELAEENVSAYSQKGVQKAQGRLSGFAAKA